jgi:cell division protein ZapA
MTNRDPHVLDVNLMGRAYRIACAPEERGGLLGAVALVDDKMHEIAEQSRATGDRLLVLTALNVAYELLQLKQASGPELEQARHRVSTLRARIGEALEQQEALF